MIERARSAAIRELGSFIEECCERIRRWFNDRVAITVIVRNLDVTDGTRDVLVTSDEDLDALRNAIGRLAADTAEAERGSK